MNLEIALAIFAYVVLVLSITIHDATEAMVAFRLGDPTARMLGRTSLNPIKHYDLFGTVIWPLLYIFRTPLALGWGKPVPVTPRNFRKPVRDEILVALSGPVANLALGLICLILLVILKHASPMAAQSLGVAQALALRDNSIATTDLPALFPLILMLYIGIVTNLLLCIFNLVPLPAFDGGRILRNFLPYNAQKTYDSIGLYLMFGFFFLGFRFIMIFFVPMFMFFNSLLFAL
ncbi:site-2 protease family protein [Terriglobus tenax]|uniref:site-2 protease family protein n=1 Tax=Terriglobus tenax TaxID=1111115 RepID=UPI0021DFBBF0|nr:site-2 protease family protein [Terriglobus tenax]